MDITSLKLAAVQDRPDFLDRAGTLDRVRERVIDAAGQGAGLIAFPEAFLPGYPDWVWRTRPWNDGSRALYARLHDQAVRVPGPTTEALGEMARDAGVYIVIGVDERSATDGTLFNSLLFIGPDGALLGCHRKLMPTGGERLVWGTGDGSTLRAYDTPYGRLGGLLCWENYMPLARTALYTQGVDLYVAPTWDNSDTWIASMRHIAREGRCFVIGVNSCIRGSDIPADIPGRDALYGGDEDWLSRGNSIIVGPDGEILAGPLIGETGILYAEVDAREARASRQEFDPVGHYARSDVLRLHVDRRPRTVESGPNPSEDDAEAPRSSEENAVPSDHHPGQPT